MDLLKTIIECSDEDVDLIIEKAINEANEKANKVDRLGFLDYGKTYNVFKGFIPLKTRIKYAQLNLEDYGMESTDFIYEFAYFIRNHNIHNKTALIYSLEYFVNSYFGFPGKTSREDIFDSNAWNTTTTDEEYFNALKNNKIGDLKGKGAAECTERGALVQQILSIFNTESYYCMGCVDLGDKQEAHCFNIVKRVNDYALLDYSVPVTSYKEDGSIIQYYPFIGPISNDEFLDFINSGKIKSFDNYYMIGNQYRGEGTQREYVVGEFEIKKENTNGKSL